MATGDDGGAVVEPEAAVEPEVAVEEPRSFKDLVRPARIRAAGDSRPGGGAGAQGADTCGAVAALFRWRGVAAGHGEV